MKYSLRVLRTAYRLAELSTELGRLSESEIEALAASVDDRDFPPIVAGGLAKMLRSDGAPRRTKKSRGAGFSEFRFEEVMTRLRNAVMHSSHPADAAEIDWLLKLILTSPAVFDSVREVDNFLSNMTGAEHATKSTGRDRVVDWYFKHINSLADEERNHLYLKIARHIFAQTKSNYREWKEVLYGGGIR